MLTEKNKRCFSKGISRFKFKAQQGKGVVIPFTAQHTQFPPHPTLDGKWRRSGGPHEMRLYTQDPGTEPLTTGSLNQNTQGVKNTLMTVWT